MTTKQKMIQKLVEKHATGSGPAEDEITVSDWMEATGMSNKGANDQLKRGVAEGYFTVRKGRVNNRQANIYKPV